MYSVVLCYSFGQVDGSERHSLIISQSVPRPRRATPFIWSFSTRVSRRRDTHVSLILVIYINERLPPKFWCNASPSDFPHYLRRVTRISPILTLKSRVPNVFYKYRPIEVKLRIIAQRPYVSRILYPKID